MRRSFLQFALFHSFCRGWNFSCVSTCTITIHHDHPRPCKTKTKQHKNKKEVKKQQEH
jgi:hypothetical protein